MRWQFAFVRLCLVKGCSSVIVFFLFFFSVIMIMRISCFLCVRTQNRNMYVGTTQAIVDYFIDVGKILQALVLCLSYLLYMVTIRQLSILFSFTYTFFRSFYQFVPTFIYIKKFAAPFSVGLIVKATKKSRGTQQSSFVRSRLGY